MPDNGLPDGWVTEPFTDIAEVNPTRPLAAGRVAPFLEMAAVREGFRGVAYVGERAANGSGAKFQNGDTIFARITPCAENGKVAIVDFLDNGAVGFGSTEFIVFSPRNGADARFLYHLVASPQLHRRAISQMRGTSGRQRVPDDFFRQGLTVSVPPPDEQRRIAEVLDAIDGAIEKTEAVIAATERLRSALLGELLTRGVPGWHTAWKTAPGIGTIPACWEVVRLGDVLSAVDYGTNVPASESPEAIPVLGMKNVGDGEIRDGDVGRAVLPDDERRALLLRAGDILFNRTNSIDLVGKVAIVRAVVGDLSFASYLLRLRTDPAKADPWWLIGFLNYRSTQNALRRMATKGASQANINPTSLRSLPLALPPLAEQEETARLFEVVRARGLQEGHRLSELGRLKGAVASALLSGRVRVRNPREDDHG